MFDRDLRLQSHALRAELTLRIVLSIRRREPRAHAALGDPQEREALKKLRGGAPGETNCY